MIETGMTKNDKRKLFVQYIMEGTSTTMNTSICTIFSQTKQTFEKSHSGFSPHRYVLHCQWLPTSKAAVVRKLCPLNELS